ncbi:unnamed protein product [Pieris brassicae]|uniref:Uncharacterized protein n=1 Tax=Pieris brassicae TaxID=7116 RepID=A0A9P0WWV8_PIEBR|nr:unnamed protein product [Pieris brassicae]
MNRDFVYDNQSDRSSAWIRAGSTLNKWLWGALCCGVPGIPCYFCSCCEKNDDDRERPRKELQQPNECPVPTVPTHPEAENPPQKCCQQSAAPFLSFKVNQHHRYPAESQNTHRNQGE